MPDVFETIERITYISDDTELKNSAKVIIDSSNAIVDLGAKRLALQAKFESADKKDIENKKKLATELDKLDKQIREHAKAVNQEAISNQKLNEVLKNEIGIIDNLKRKIDGIKIAKGFATTEKEVKDLNKQLIQVQAELNRIDNINVGITNKTGGNGILSSVLGGVGIGTGIELARQGFNLLKTGISDSIAEFEDAQDTARTTQRVLASFGGEKYFDGIIDESNTLAEKLHNLFGNGEIIKAETRLIQYGKISREEISKLIPVIADLASAEQITLVEATEKVVNIMEGRGGQILRDYGVTVKGVKTEHDRLNVVLGDFATKLNGATDAYAESAKGISQTNAVLLAGIEERFGAAFSNIKQKVLPIITDILEGINTALETLDERNQKAGKGAKNTITSFKNGGGGYFGSLVNSIIGDPEKAKEAFEKVTKDIQGLQEKIDVLDKLRSTKGIGAGNAIRIDNQLEGLKRDLEISKGILSAIKQEEAKISKGPINPNAQLAEGEAEKIVKKANAKIKAASQNDPAEISFKLVNDEQAYNLGKLDTEIKAANDKVDSETVNRVIKRGEKVKEINAGYAKDEQDLIDENLAANSQMWGNADAEQEASMQNRLQLWQTYLEGAGSVLNKVFEIEADLMNQKIDQLTDKIVVAQRELDAAEKIADRGNAELYDKQRKRVIELENERAQAAEKQREDAKIQAVLNQALAFTQALLAVTNAGVSGDAYTAAARIALVVAALGTAYSFAQVFKGAREGLDEAGEGRTGSDSLNLPTPSGEDYYGNYYHLANREAVIQNHDGTADRYRPTIKAIRRGLLPEWVNDIAMGKTLPFMDNSAIQQAVIIVKSEGSKEVSQLREDVNLLVRMMGNIQLHSTILDPYGNIELQKRILGQQKLRNEL